MLNIFKTKYFTNYRLQKAYLLKWIKNQVSEHLSTVNMLKGLKHCLNPQGSSFAIFFISLKELPFEKLCLSSI